MPRNDSQRKWDKANMTVLSCRVTKEKADRFREICHIHGVTTNAMLLSFVNKLLSENENRD